MTSISKVRSPWIDTLRLAAAALEQGTVDLELAKKIRGIAQSASAPQCFTISISGSICYDVFACMPDIAEKKLADCIHPCDKDYEIVPLLRLPPLPVEK
ncbi:hypothetical protein [Stenotrophomonas sp. YIM B06876]|uniref:hypothetical protein n=1 Tax=Stenotrophomonas sp. YIM B06876 TaxID=3060211 RepID=UPI0027396EAF|nr:hypothetical protein [Stenotrophomonas sp. YIM B06876]